MIRPEDPFHLYRFHVEFFRTATTKTQGEASAAAPICQGGFSECTGLEATMEPKVIKAGGANYGPFQRVGPVTFATVILKRGVTTNRDLWVWFSHVAEKGKSAFRLDAKITVQAPGDEGPETAFAIRLHRALPIKLKVGDLNARATEVGVEELHLAHEGLTLEPE
jgi:phage tail-like protein